MIHCLLDFWCSALIFGYSAAPWSPPIRFHHLAGGLLVREYRATDEEAAKYLGGCLQVPARGLDWAFQRCMTIQEIAEHFGASLQMVRYRCNMTGHGLPV